MNLQNLTPEDPNYEKAHAVILNFFKNPDKLDLNRLQMIFNKQMDDLFPGWIKYAGTERKIHPMKKDN
jgi:hypothetical protein